MPREALSLLPVEQGQGDEEARGKRHALPTARGGAIVTRSDLRSGNRDIYVQHVLANGAVDPRLARR